MISGKMTPLTITDYTMVSALGAGQENNWDEIIHQRSGLRPCSFENTEKLTTWVGEVSNLAAVTLPAEFAQYQCRNNQLAYYALQQDGFIPQVQALRQRYGKKRIGVFIGTSTSGVQQLEQAYFEWHQTKQNLPDWFDYRTTHNCFSAADFVQAFFGLEGYAVAISTACSSSAKIFASAARAIKAGICDAAIVGGVDTLCLTTLYGFNSLQLLSPDKCAPFAENRRGISIGEAAGFAILEAENHKQNSPASGSVKLLGFGESSDAYHMSSPHPEGLGAYAAMQQALQLSSLSAADIQYVNMHGTGTKANDSAEAQAVLSLLGSEVACSSTKAWTGHSLGAAGIIEALIAVLAIKNSTMPANLCASEIDNAIPCNILSTNKAAELSHVMTNSFGFGGTNCSLVLGL